MTDTQIFSVQLIASDSQASVAFDCRPDELVFDAARRQGIYMASYCKQGACGACGARLLGGTVDYVRKIKGAPMSPDIDDTVRPCSMFAGADLVLEPLSPWKLAEAK